MLRSHDYNNNIMLLCAYYYRQSAYGGTRRANDIISHWPVIATRRENGYIILQLQMIYRQYSYTASVIGIIPKYGKKLTYSADTAVVMYHSCSAAGINNNNMIFNEVFFSPAAAVTSPQNSVVACTPRKPTRG